MSASAEIAGRVVFSELPLYSIRAELIRLNDGNKKFQKI